MGKIPEFQQRVLRSEFTGIDTSGTAILRGAQQLGAALQQRQNRIDNDFVTEQSVQLRLSANNILRDNQNQFQKNPHEGDQEFETAFRLKLDEVKQKSTSGRASQALDRVGQEILGRSQLKRQSWRNAQELMNYENMQNNNLRDLSQSVQGGSRQDYEDAIQDMDNSVQSGSARGIDKNDIQKIDQLSKDKLTSDYVNNLILNDQFDDAEALLKDPEIKKRLGLNSFNRLKRDITNQKTHKQKMAANFESLKITNPYKWAEKSGHSEGIEAMPIGQDIGHWSRKRQILRSNLQDRGVNAPMFTSLEVRQINGIIESGSVNDKQALSESLNAGMTNDQIAEMSSQLSTTPSGRAFVVGVGIGNDDPDTARDIFKGVEKLELQTVKVASRDDFVASVTDVLGESLPSEDARRQLIDSTRALHANSGTPDILRREDANDLVRRLIGPVTSINGRKTVSFRDQKGQFVSEDDFEDLVEDLTPEQVIKVHGRLPKDNEGNDIDITDFDDTELFGRPLKLMSAGENGKYFIVRGGGLALDIDEKGKSKPFVLDLRKIRGQ